MPLPLLALAAIGAGSGLGLGFTTDKFFGDDDYSVKEGLGDATLGALTSGGGTALGMGAKGLAWQAAKRGGTRIPSALLSAGSGGYLNAARPMLRHGAASTVGLGGLFGGDGPEAAMAGEPAPSMMGLGHIGSMLGGVMGGVQSKFPVPENPILAGGMYGGLGEPAAFTKSYTDYLKDPELNSLADQSIIQQNAAIGRENKDIRTQMMRDTRASNQAGQTAINQINNIGNQNASTLAQIADNHAASAQQTVDDADALASSVGATLVDSDSHRAELQAQNAGNAHDVADSRNADSNLLSKLAASGQDTIADISAAEAQATAASAQNIRSEAMKSVMSNRGQAADNWGQKSGIVGSLADTALQRDLQAHQLGLQSWAQRFDALNSWRETQMKVKEMEAGGADPAMINAMMGIANQPSGYTQKGTGEDGMEWSYEAPAWQTWDPAIAQQYGGMLQQSIGINPFQSSVAPPKMGG